MTHLVIWVFVVALLSTVVNSFTLHAFAATGVAPVHFGSSSHLQSIASSEIASQNLENVWRNIKRPLLSISQKKGVTEKHQSNFRTLLSDHKLVKVKFSGLKEEGEDRVGALDVMIESLRDDKVEIIRKQMSDGVVLFAMEGFTAKVESGEHVVNKKKKWLRKPLIKKETTDNGADSVDVD